MNHYKFYSGLCSLTAGLIIGQVIGFNIGLFATILLFAYFYQKLKLYENTNEILKEKINFTR
jgi:hypothetical protein